MRTTAETLQLDAVQALLDASRELRLPVDPTTDEPDVVELDVNGRHVRVAVHGATLLDGPRAEKLTRRTRGSRTAPLVVGDKILEAARARLEADGWSWLDRRGRLRLSAPGTLIDVEVAPRPRSAPPRRPDAALAAHGGQEVAVALLLSPDEPPGVRQIARGSGLAPSTISRVRKELHSAGLVRPDGRPVTPDLFWALAEHWAPTWIAVDRPIPPSDRRLADLGANLGDLGRAGFAVGDTRGALAWDAPVVASADAAPAIYVPDRVTRDRVLEVWGRADSPSGAGRVAVAPVHSVTKQRFERRGEVWPVAHPLIVALDLAVDRARGHQILDEWDPGETRRVW